MKYLAAALVMVALIAADFLADMGLVSVHDNHGWDQTGGIAFVLFCLLIAFGRDR